jgi:hypothetical protein
MTRTARQAMVGVLGGRRSTRNSTAEPACTIAASGWHTLILDTQSEVHHVARLRGNTPQATVRATWDWLATSMAAATKVGYPDGH